MLTFHPVRATSAAAALALLAGCAGAPSVTPPGAPQGAQQFARSVRPEPMASGVPWLRVGRGVARQARIRHGAGTVLLSESFTGATTPKGQWYWKDDACLTAGTASTPKTSIPACGANAPQDSPGNGALELNPPSTYVLGFTGYKKAFPTANGLAIAFDYYSFNGSYPGADGTVVFLSVGSESHPAKPAGSGGALGYINDNKHDTGLLHAYLGVGFDEYGNFSNYLKDGPGFIPETIAVGGAQTNGYAYLGGVTDASGQPVSLPFDLDSPNSYTRPGTPLSVDISITPQGLLEVSVDVHDGNGPTTYVSEDIVGVNGQPAVPSSVYVGFIAATGTYYNRHQVQNLTISTLQ
jgi:hypothetical protein